MALAAWLLLFLTCQFYSELVAAMAVAHASTTAENLAPTATESPELTMPLAWCSEDLECKAGPQLNG